MDPAALRRAAEQILLIGLPLLLTAFELSVVRGRHTFALDFHGWYWPAGQRVLHGLSPYALPPLRALNYPAFGALIFVPFALLPHAAADWVFALLVFAAVPLTLRLLAVRDWRIYGIVLLWQPILVGWETANVSLLLVVGLAAVWRYRDRAAVAGLILAVLISVKLFLFPVGVWWLATRRYRALGWAIAGTTVLNLIGWAVLGFHEIPIYVSLLQSFARMAERWGYSLIGLALHLGAGQGLADAIGILAAAVVVLASLRVHGTRRDLVLYSACLAACLLASPVVETHYLALMLLPLAIAQPSLSRLWALPIVLIITPADHPSIWQHVLSLCVVATVMLTTAVGPRGHGARWLGQPARALRR
jgi:hypothetical protein